MSTLIATESGDEPTPRGMEARERRFAWDLGSLRRPSRRPIATVRRVVVVGHGMVGHRLCEELRKHRELEQTEVLVFGDEPRSAYDRVHLGDVIRGGAAERLTLGEPHFYQERRIEVVQADPVVAIERTSRFITTASGRRESYDHLVLCTGAAAVTGSFAELDSEMVRPLRTLDDALIIRTKALRCRTEARRVVIIGGGLLGLELATDLIALGCHVDVLEGADYPLSRQLDQGAGEVLRSLVERPGLVVSVGCRVTKLQGRGEEIRVELADGRTFDAGLVVPAMGIRARDQLARDAGLPCDLFGGVEVDDTLLTRDKAISAIGECARHRGVVYGLVAPGYAMAEQVARRLAGKPAQFRGVHVGTRLKVEGLEVTVLGESAATGLGVRSAVASADGSYRRLAVRRGKVIGITVIGAWPELARAQDALSRSETVRERQLGRFERHERVWNEQAISLAAWPDDATVCTCMGVSCGALKVLAREEGITVEQLSSRSGAGSVCGSCKPLLQTLTQAPSAKVIGTGSLHWFSALSVLGAVAFYLAPPVALTETAQQPSLSLLWTDKSLRQVTGFFLLALFSASLAFSARKRIKRFSFGDFERWRVVHAALGAFCLFAAFLHTGFRKGQGLDHALLLIVLASIFLGGVAGGYRALLGLVRPERGQLLRAWLIRAHLYLLWPLPVALAFHVLKVYFF